MISGEDYVEYHAESEEITDNGHVISEMKESRNADDGKEVEATRTGKIACLYKQDERIDRYSKTYRVVSVSKRLRCDSFEVAVIGDEEDDVEAMIKWYWQRVKEINEEEGKTHYPNI